MARSRSLSIAFLLLAGCSGGSTPPGGGGEGVLAGASVLDELQDSRIFFTSWRDGNGEIFVMRGDGSQPTNRPEATGFVMDGDGRRLAFVGDCEITLLDLETLEVVWRLDVFAGQPFAGPTAGIVKLDFSPDGSQIVVVGIDGGTELALVSVEGSGRRPVTDLRLLTETRRPEFTPVFSPDGSKLAFVRETDGFEGYRERGLEIYVMNADGSGVVDVSRSDADDREPAWSPDGQWLAFTSDREDDDEEIYRARPDGTGLTRLTVSPGLDLVATWRSAPRP